MDVFGAGDNQQISIYWTQGSLEHIWVLNIWCWCSSLGVVQTAHRVPVHMVTFGEHPRAAPGLLQTTKRLLLKGTTFLGGFPQWHTSGCSPSHEDGRRSNLEALPVSGYPLDGHFQFQNNWELKFVHSPDCSFLECAFFWHAPRTDYCDQFDHGFSNGFSFFGP